MQFSDNLVSKVTKLTPTRLIYRYKVFLSPQKVSTLELWSSRQLYI